MFSTLRTRFGIPGIVSMIALVFAMTGGAWAASHFIITSTKQIKPSVLKALQGKQGPPGTNGTNGTNGAKGEKGDTGTPGTPGTPGKSVVLGDAGVECEEGGTSVEVEGTPASKEFVCNGEEGPPGSPWTVDGTLPSGKTETGTWSVLTEAYAALVPLSIPIELANPLGSSAVHFNPAGFEGVAGEDCPGSVTDPKAALGQLCVYTGLLTGAASEVNLYNPEKEEGEEEEGVSKTGTAMYLTNEAVAIMGWGTWAVTAP
jgi:hypothetical protein